MVEEGGGEEKVRRDGSRKGLNSRREIVCGRYRDDIADWRRFSIGLGVISSSSYWCSQGIEGED